MNDLDNRPHSELVREAGENWADLESAAELLENSKSSILSEWMVELGADMAISRAEATIKAQPRWKELLQQITEARRLANRARISYEYEKMRFSEWNNSEANRRMEAKLI